jgi:hypothetical protein
MLSVRVGDDSVCELFFFPLSLLPKVVLILGSERYDPFEWLLVKLMKGVVGRGGAGSRSEGWVGSEDWPSDSWRLPLLENLCSLEKSEDLDFRSSTEWEEEPLWKGARKESLSSIDLLFGSGMLSVLWDSDGRFWRIYEPLPFLCGTSDATEALCGKNIRFGVFGGGVGCKKYNVSEIQETRPTQSSLESSLPNAFIARVSVLTGISTQGAMFASSLAGRACMGASLASPLPGSTASSVSLRLAIVISDPLRAIPLSTTRMSCVKGAGSTEQAVRDDEEVCIKKEESRQVLVSQIGDFFVYRLLLQAGSVPFSSSFQ